MGEERGSEESEILRNMWEDFAGYKEVAPGVEDSCEVIADEELKRDLGL